VVAAFGLAATVGFLITPVGPGQHGGAAPFMQALDNAVISQSGDEVRLAAARREADELARTDARTRHEAVVQALQSCGGHCGDLTPAMVEGNPTLLKDALLLIALDRNWNMNSSADRFAGVRR
jgi:hypothetical protein